MGDRLGSYDGAPKPTPSRSETSSPSAAGMTHAERVASAKERAQRRIAERMAAAGLKPSADSGETLQQRQERDKREREDRLRRAEEEEAKREAERQRRLADEASPAPPAAAVVATKAPAKKPPPPPSRKGRTDSAEQADSKKAEDAARAAEQFKADQRVLKEEQGAQGEERQRLE